MTSKNLTAATTALAKALDEDAPAGDELAGYLAQMSDVAAALKALRKRHAKAIATEASKRSRAKRAERVAAGLALLAEKESAAGR